MALAWWFTVFILVIFYTLYLVESKTQESRQLSSLLQLQSKETTTVDFVRLVVMRLIFGLASAMGYSESLSNFLGGVFVPPGADYDDDYDYVPDLF